MCRDSFLPLCSQHGFSKASLWFPRCDHQQLLVSSNQTVSAWRVGTVPLGLRVLSSRGSVWHVEGPRMIADSVSIKGGGRHRGSKGRARHPHMADFRPLWTLGPSPSDVEPPCLGCGGKVSFEGGGFPYLFPTELSVLNGMPVPPGVALSCSVPLETQPRKEFAHECEFFSGPPCCHN